MSKSVINPRDFIQDEDSSTSSEETMPIIPDVQSIDSIRERKRSKPSQTATVNYGPICIRRRQNRAPTLATGRRPKDTIITGEDITKREMRRLKNREAARNLKKLRDNIEHHLKDQVIQLESEEQSLSNRVQTLQLYKQQLQQQYRQTDPIYQIITQTAANILSELKRQQTLRNLPIEPKEEPRSPSPQWQLLFRI